MRAPTLNETSINIIAEGTRLEGKIDFDHITRVHGNLVGEVRSAPGSTLILSETSLVEGNIHADTLMIDGFVQGDVYARTRVLISRTGRVVGNVKTKSLKLEFGAYFEGKCSTDQTVE
jgi:cytoskeletal protein CcmA (bactofilin family)